MNIAPRKMHDFGIWGVLGSLVGDPNASLVRLWRDTGLYDGDGAPRPSLSSWRSVFSRPLRQ